MSDRLQNRYVVRGKIDWEGGFPEVMDYGLRARHMPEGDTELQEAWEKLDAAWALVEEAWQDVDALLPDPDDPDSPWPDNWDEL